ncbi:MULTISPECIES: TIGR03808 family TAT-translocated repetitive protein [unclassified Mesorhizobium]|uniref:TIGR03808 family TAT-translocated repetitive protein n=1 Tax=unclassified Mesorhizobium TaxID=325217 RepID=UPI000FCAC953|nr:MULTISPECIES: TIGR03808 family TAT-translocated repetitive protein [unclassified Mesorhizobium]MDG4900589.1 TIGR03808 family TAT-translocated repetitive protein [Mesorhizobium sp. WSM4962]MDG4908676.1 TIGR03808 family TAT-translocated repetitive protein [Mesorhizobium sp. WSM4898]MDG4917174.1 TIGR03808 family TAT-translocated repetitive protein [Mesorhizobium sp. WSM4989]RUW02222.1 TIGR03808 family TAT-translocated repetitive protein [Mesorhizobium sp. M1A.F.Ca.IN.020.04.1.1]RUW12857.1 TIGR
MLNRRTLLARTTGLAAAGLLAGKASAKMLPGIEKATMRGSINAIEIGVQPGALDDQSKAFAKMLSDASDRDAPVFLPPGTYLVSNLKLPARVRLSGVPGATRIVYGGNGHLMMAEQAEHIELSGLVLDGSNRWLADYTQGLLDLRRVAHLAIDNCQVTGSGKNGLALEHVSGRIGRCDFSGAADAGIYSVEAGGLEISGNTISDCANGGILVHRWQQAEDGTIVSGNRVQRIGARSGGTGQNGNGINAFRAGNVIISANVVSDCAFSAIRANSSSNLQITGNTCSRSGETGIYSEFSFEGAILSNNLVDGAANGISIVNFNEGGRMAVCSNNIVRNLSTVGPYTADPPGFGVGISAEAETSVCGNVVENAPLYGMQLGWGPYLRNVVATGNIIRKSGTGIVVSVVEGSGSAVISDNIIDAAQNGAIIGQRWANPVTGDLARSTFTGYAHLTVERNKVS